MQYDEKWLTESRRRAYATGDAAEAARREATARFHERAARALASVGDADNAERAMAAAAKTRGVAK